MCGIFFAPCIHMTLNKCTVKKIQTHFFICTMHTESTCNEDHLEYTNHYLLLKMQILTLLDNTDSYLVQDFLKHVDKKQQQC